MLCYDFGKKIKQKKGRFRKIKYFDVHTGSGSDQVFKPRFGFNLTLKTGSDQNLDPAGSGSESLFLTKPMT